MPGKTFRLEVVTPERRVLEETVESIILPGSKGLLGVLPGHAPMIVGLGIGLVKYGRERGPKKVMSVSGGFAEIAYDRVVVLADTAELPEEIDVARARAARERALQRLQKRSREIDHARARSALLRALNRLRAADYGEE